MSLDKRQVYLMRRAAWDVVRRKGIDVRHALLRIVVSANDPSKARAIVIDVMGGQLTTFPLRVPEPLTVSSSRVPSAAQRERRCPRS